MESRIPGISLEPKVIKRLLDGLSSDDSFRDLFVRSPHDALLQAGYQLDAEDPRSALQLRLAGIGLSVRALPSKDMIRALRATLDAQLHDLAPMQPIFLSIDGLSGRSIHRPQQEHAAV